VIDLYPEAVHKKKSSPSSRPSTSNGWGEKASSEKTTAPAKASYTLGSAWVAAKSHTSNFGPFGQGLKAVGAMADLNPMQFSTKPADAETGLLNYGYRLLNPNIGRWVGRDPLEESDGPNVYGFVHNSPVNNVDPDGLETNHALAFKPSLNIDAAAVHEGGVWYMARPVAYGIDYQAWQNPLLWRTVRVVGGSVEVGFGIAAFLPTKGLSIIAVGNGVDNILAGIRDKPALLEQRVYAAVGKGPLGVGVYFLTQLATPCSIAGKLPGLPNFTSPRLAQAGAINPTAGTNLMRISEKTVFSDIPYRALVPNRFEGVREASTYLKGLGVPRGQRVQILQSFEPDAMRLRLAGENEFALRYYSDPKRQGGRYLFETFPASRESLAVKPEWNTFSGFKQFQIRPGAAILEGPAAAQGPFLPGGQQQKFILDWKLDLNPQ
jgi:RHS repeat-associated protein